MYEPFSAPAGTFSVNKEGVATSTSFGAFPLLGWTLNLTLEDLGAKPFLLNT